MWNTMRWAFPASLTVFFCTSCTTDVRDYAPEAVEDAAVDEASSDGGSRDASDTGTADAPSADGGPADATQSEGDVVCFPTSCQKEGAECGMIADDCGGMLDCGTCPTGQTCGGGGEANRCAVSDGGFEDAADAADVAPCTPGQSQCVGLQVMTCDMAGQWQPAETCSTSCVNGACEDSCPLPWGGTLAHGEQATAYLHASETSPSLCSENQETRVCQNGVLSGSYTHPGCTQHYRDCPLSGYGTLLHGGQVTSYVSATVPCGQTCTTTTISCTDGTLAGASEYHGDCTVDSCDCHFGHAKGFAHLSPGQSCTSELVNVNTTSGCTGGAQYYATYGCTYTCNANGTVTRSYGGPCEMGNGACGGSVSSSSTTTCPDGW